MNFNSFDEIIDFAIKGEEEAYQIYTDLASKMDRPHLRKIFEDFAREELGHKRKLTAIKGGVIDMPKVKPVLDLEIGDYLVDVEPSADMTFQDALIIAMKKEKKAFKLYSDLAEKVDDESLHNLFLILAHEEAHHQLRFEIEYDNMMDEIRQE